MPHGPLPLTNPGVAIATAVDAASLDWMGEEARLQRIAVLSKEQHGSHDLAPGQALELAELCAREAETTTTGDALAWRSHALQQLPGLTVPAGSTPTGAVPSPDLLYVRAALARDVGDRSTALAALTRIVEEYPGWEHAPEAYIDLGDLFGTGEARSLTAYRRATEAAANPRWAEAERDLGWAYWNQGEVDQAIAAMKAVESAWIDGHPRASDELLKEAWAALAYFWVETGSPACWGYFDARGGGALTRTELARVAMVDENYTAAAAAYGWLLVNYPAAPESDEWREDLLLTQVDAANRTVPAVVCWLQGACPCPIADDGSYAATYRHAAIHGSRGDCAEAYNLYVKVVAMDPSGVHATEAAGEAVAQAQCLEDNARFRSPEDGGVPWSTAAEMELRALDLLASLPSTPAATGAAARFRAAWVAYRSVPSEDGLARFVAAIRQYPKSLDATTAAQFVLTEYARRGDLDRVVALDKEFSHVPNLGTPELRAQFARDGRAAAVRLRRRPP